MTVHFTGLVRHEGAPSSVANERVALDDIDLRIITMLQQDGRISNARLAEQVGISESACLNRVRRMERDRVIISYRTVVNRRLFRPAVTMMVQVELESQQLESCLRFNDMIATIPEIVEACTLNGHYDYMLRILARDPEHFLAIMDDMLVRHGGIRSYVASMVQLWLKDEPLSADYLRAWRYDQAAADAADASSGTSTTLPNILRS